MIAQSEAGGVRKCLAAAAFLTLATLGGAACAENAATAGNAAGKAAARLMDGGVLDGARHAGLEIILSGKAVTYWRDPGEAGVPPRFDFSASENIATADVSFPQPRRLDEGGAQAFGYSGEAIFPIRVTPRDASRPAVLALSLDFAVCDRLCLPVHADLRLELPPQPPAADPRVAAALKKTPRRLDAAQTAAFASIAAQGAGKWLLRLKPGAARDVFVEAPAGFYVEAASSSEPDAFLLTLVDHPSSTPLPDAPARVTISGPAPVEFDLILPN
jgi:DsbC/DsbD-like thiol-disulfide interchange protein